MAISGSTSKRHAYFGLCPDPAAYDIVENASQFIRASDKVARQPGAEIPYREQLDKGFAPRLFGAAIEALAEAFFDEFGKARYNICEYRSRDGLTEALYDSGYDATALTYVDKDYGTVIKKHCPADSPVYIQVKGRVNVSTELYTNDGSNVMNFYANSLSNAVAEGKAYESRYIIFTTCKGLHWRLRDNTHHNIEVVNYRAINLLTKNNKRFWDDFRGRFI